MSSHSLRFLTGGDVRRALPMAEAIEVMRDAFVQLSQDRAVVPVRSKLELGDEKGRALFMPVYLPENRRLSLKVVTVMDENPDRGLPLIQAIVLLIDASTGRPVAIMDGEVLTALRTGAASGLATRLLAAEDAKVVAIFGAGIQARTQLEAISCVRDVKEAWVFGRDRQRAEDFSRSMSTQLALAVEVARDEAVLQRADIVCAATTAQSPVFKHDRLKPGVHINAVGCYQPQVQEIPSDTVVAAKLVVDHRPACLAEAGDVIQPIRQGLIRQEHILAELGEIAAGRKTVRESGTEITLFKSVGNAVQDLAAASRVLENATKLGLGTTVDL